MTTRNGLNICYRIQPRGLIVGVTLARYAALVMVRKSLDERGLLPVACCGTGSMT